MRSRCLVIGAAGQLGRALCAALRDAYEIIENVYRTPQPHQVQVDLGDLAGVAAQLDELKPDWIVIAGAYCQVDRAETDPQHCWQVNVEGPRAIAAYARDHGNRVVYYSSDQVFDGSKDSAYRESEPVHPLNVYARSKAQGEVGLRELLPDRHLILRTAWLYGPDPARRNFVLRVVDQLTAGGHVPVPVDQWGNPTYTEDLASITQHLMKQDASGTFHATGPDYLDRVSLAKRICAWFQLDDAGVIPMPTSQLGQAARRALRVRLDGQKLAATGAKPCRDIEAGLAALQRWQAASAQAMIR